MSDRSCGHFGSQRGRQYVMTPKFVGSWIYLYTMNWKLTMVTGITAYRKEVYQMKMQDEMFMKKAIELSKLAVQHGNEPFGAVLVKNDEIVFSNENQIYTKHDPTFHGEAGLIREFCAQTGITNLHEYTLYSSCEPCFMCSGAMVWVKLGRLVYGASNIDLEHILGNTGCNCSKIVFDNSFWQPQVSEGVLREGSLSILKE